MSHRREFTLAIFQHNVRKFFVRNLTEKCMKIKRPKFFASSVLGELSDFTFLATTDAQTLFKAFLLPLDIIMMCGINYKKARYPNGRKRTQKMI